jgi:hypothetical protein
MMMDASTLNSDILGPGKPLPPDTIMVAKAIEILNHSPHGQQLAEFTQKENITIKIIATPQPTTYLPESRLVYIGFNRNNPVSPSRFVLMVTGILREAQQELSGIKHPSLNAPMQEHMKVSMAKHEDKLWFMCMVAYELNAQDTFTEYKFLDELRKMGHDEALDLFLKQENKN